MTPVFVGVLVSLLPLSSQPPQRDISPKAAPASTTAQNGTASSLAVSQGIDFSFAPRDPQQKPWKLHLSVDGSGYFQTEGEAATTPIAVSPATLHTLFFAEPVVVGGECQTKVRNIAKTGSKTIAFLSPEAHTCTFDYSDAEALNRAASVFQAIAETLRMGEKIAHDRRFDHLGLNADLEALMEEAKAGRAIELGNIAPVLQSVVDNDDLMDVVRRRAQSLMQDATLGVPEKK